MSMTSINVLCTNCGLASRRPGKFALVRRYFICGACKELIPLDSGSVPALSPIQSERTEAFPIEHERAGRT